ncbi:hypothetical protein [Clostridium sp. Marseille-Q7071]
MKRKKINYKLADEDRVHIRIKSSELEDLTLDIAENKIPLKGIYEVKESLEEKYLKTMGEDIDA